jgi:hypothetical protein
MNAPLLDGNMMPPVFDEAAFGRVTCVSTSNQVCISCLVDHGSEFSREARHHVTLPTLRWTLYERSNQIPTAYRSTTAYLKMVDHMGQCQTILARCLDGSCSSCALASREKKSGLNQLHRFFWNDGWTTT